MPPNLQLPFQYSARFLGLIALGCLALAQTKLIAEQVDAGSPTAVRLKKQLADLEGKARIPLLLNLAKIREDDPTLLQRLADEVLELNAGESLRVEVQAQLHLSNALQRKGHFPEARAMAKTALDNARDLPDQTLRAKTCYWIAVAEFRLANAKQAKKFAHQAKRIQERAKDHKELATTHTLLGVIARSVGEYDEAISSHLSALRISEALGDVNAVARSQNNLGLIYWNLDRLEEAHDALLRALEIYESTNRTARIGTCQSNIGLILVERNMPEDALPFLEKALVSATVRQDRPSHAKVLSNLAFAYSKMEDFEQALAYNEQALKLRKEIGDRKGQVRTIGAIGNVYVDREEPEKAIPLLEEALELAISIDAKTEWASLLELLSRSHAMLKQFDSALDYSYQARELEEAISGTEVQKRILELENASELERRARATRNLTELAELRQQKIVSQREAQRQLLLGSLVLGVCLVAITGLFVSRARALHKTRLAYAQLQTAANRLSESESRYRMLFQSGEVPKMLFDAQTLELIDLNPAAEKICSFSSRGDSRPQGNLAEHLSPMWLQKAVTEYLAADLIDEAVHDNYWTEPNANARWTEIRGTTVMVDGVRARLLSIRDTTEKRALEKEQVHTERLESLGVLAGGIAHDFNNALMSIVGYTALAQQQIDEPTRELELVEEVALQASQLTSQLLAFAKGGEPVRVAQEISELLTRSVELANSGSRMKTEFDIQDDLQPCEIDAGQFRQVVSNLVINATEATGDGGLLRVSASNFEGNPYSGESEAGHCYVRIDFEDNGSGIADDASDRIFDPYWTTKENGTGLGLTTTFSIVKRHGGAVTFHSGEGQGAIFSVFFPAAANTDPQACGSPEPSNLPTVPEQAALKILVLDDERLLRNMYQRLLEAHGHTVITAADGEAAERTFFEAYESGAPFDLLIMDLTIPGGIGGCEALSNIQLQAPETVAIVASGYSNDPTMANFREAGFAGAISKPFSEQALLSAIQKITADARRRSSNDLSHTRR